MKKVKKYKGFTIYQATSLDDKLFFENSDFGLFLPFQSPKELFYPDFCSDNIQELIDFVDFYDC